MQSGAALLAEWIEKREYQQTRVADLFGISEGYVSMLLSGERVPGRDKALFIEDLTGIPVKAWVLSPDDIKDSVGATVGRNSKSNKE